MLAQGLNGLAGLDVTDSKLITPAEDDGTNLRGKVVIPNPSVMTIEMVSHSSPIVTHSHTQKMFSQS